MPSRRSPSMREKSVRIDRALAAMSPGTHQGRTLVPAPPLSLRPSVPAVPASPVLWVGTSEPTDGSVFWYDTADTCAAGTGTPVTHTEPFSGTSNYPSGPVVTDGITWLHRAPNYGIDDGTYLGPDGAGGILLFDGHSFDFTGSAACIVFPAEGADGTMTVTDLREVSGSYFTGVCWRVSSVATSTSVDQYWCLRPNGNVHKVLGSGAVGTVYLACGAIPDHATVEITTSGDTHTVTINGTVAGSFTDSFNNTATGWGVLSDNGGGFGVAGSFTVTSAPPIVGHPLKVDVAGDWATVACVVPV